MVCDWCGERGRTIRITDKGTSRVCADCVTEIDRELARVEDETFWNLVDYLEELGERTAS